MSSLGFSWGVKGFSLTSAKGVIQSLLIVLLGCFSFGAQAVVVFSVPATDPDGNFTISWSGARSMAELYEFKNGSWGNYIYINGTSGSFNVTGKVQGSYTYRLRECLVTGTQSGPSYSCVNYEKTVVVGVASPDSISVNINGPAIAASWSPSSGATSYELQRNSSTVYTGSATSYTDTGVTGGTSYTYSVRACNTTGCSGWKTAASITAVSVPAIPASITASVYGTSISLSWTPSSGAASYDVQRGTTIIRQGGPAYTHVDSSPVPGTAYTYSARACNAAGCSAWRTSASISVPSIPSIPGSFTATVTGPSITLNWSYSSGASSYEIHRDSILLATKQNTSNHVDNTVTAGIAYVYRIRACNSAGCSGWRNSSSVTVPIIPVPPSSISASMSGFNVYITWPNSSGATRHELQRNNVAYAAASPLTSWIDQNVVVGSTYTYRARACNGTGCSAWATAAPITINHTAFDFTSQATSTFNYPITSSTTPQLPSSQFVAITQGSGSVSSGTATYSVKIQLPPATKDLKPNLALNYSSHGGNGLLGVGWGMSGFSTISRCRTTFAFEGANAQDSNLRYTVSDRLCLDGKKLEIKSSPTAANDATFWSNGAEYRTSIDNFSKVIAYGASANSGHAYFKVWTKDGKILTYGENSIGQNSQIYAPGQPNGAIKTWALDKVEDAYGNTYTISYTQDATTGEYYPIHASFSPEAAVVFTYKDRAAQVPWGFDMGNKYEHRKILEEIVTYVGVTQASNPAAGTPVRKYRMFYETNPFTDRERVREITECGYSAGSWVCARPLIFAWQNGEFGFDNAASQTLSYCSGGVIDDATQLIDLDADGYNDVIHKSGNVSWGDNNTCFTSAPWITQGVSNLTGAQAIMTMNGYALLVKQINTDLEPDRHILGLVHNINRNNQSVQYLQIASHDIDAREAISGDFNNDGLGDFIYNGLYYKQNHNTSIGFTTSVGLSTGPFGERGSFALTDLDGDGLKDVLSTYVNYNQSNNMPYGVTQYGSKTRRGLTNSPGSFASAFSFLANETELFVVGMDYYRNPIQYSGGMFRTLVDVNGDGLKDYLYHRVGEGGAPASTGGWFYRLNMQNGGVGPQVYTGIIAARSDQGNHVANHYSYSYDYDKDGREDLVAIIPEQPDLCGMRILLSRYQNSQLAFEVATDANGNRVVVDGGGCTPIYQDGMTFTIGDINNDGIADYYHKGNVRYGKPAQPDLLTSISDGFGAQIQFEYGPLSKAINYVKPLYTPDTIKPIFPQVPIGRGMQVVKKMSVSNGQGGWLNTFYNYSGGKVDLQGRGSLGFAKIETTDTATGVITITDFNQSYPFVGRTKSEVVKSTSGALIGRTDNFYAVHPQNGRFPYLDYSINRSYQLLTSLESSPLSVVKSQGTYDSCGNSLSRTTTVGTSLSGATVNGVLNIETVAHSIPNNSDDDCSNDFVTETEIIKSEAGGINARSVVHTYEPNAQYEIYSQTGYEGTQVSATTTIERDTKGIITSTTTTASDINTTTTAPRTMAFGSFEKESYPTTITNAKGHSATLQYDYRFGTVKQETDPNGLVSSRNYDVLGRSTREVASDGTVTELLSYYCTSAPLSCPANAVYLVVTRETNPNEPGKLGAPLSVTFYDSVQREVHKQVYSLDSALLKTDIQYSSNGRLHRVSEPYTGFASYWTTYSNYDVLGRAKTVVRPDGGIKNISFVRVGTTLKTTESVTVVTPAGNKTQATSRYTNALGQIVKVEDALLTPISYSYDAQGNLVTTSVNGAIATKITLVHDVAGNKTRITDPDAGIIDFAYNGFGELRKQTWQPGVTGHEKSIAYTYDVLGRQTNRIDQPASGSTTSYSWVWDTLQAGNLTSRSGNGFSETYGYDGFSRLSTQTTTLTGLSGSKVFTYLYDRFSRPTVTSYPSGLKVRQEYHSAGLHVRTTDVTNTSDQKVLWALGSTSNDRGQLTHELYGNGVVNKVSYRDDNGRLGNIVSGRLSAANTIPVLNGDIQNLSYEFDSLGNLYSRMTQRTSNNGMQLENIREAFDYDVLSRMKSSSTTGLFSRIKDYDYDALGNLISHTETGALRYDGINGAGVHAVTSSGASGTPAYKTYHYDKYGNVIQRGGEAITYSVFNKPLTISGGSGTSTFAYGPDHERYKQTSGGKTTYVINGGSYEEVVSGSTVTQKSYVGGFFIHAKTGSTTEITYLHKDHLGSIDAMTDANGNFLSRMSFDVWGNRQQSDWRTGSPTELASFKTSMGYTAHEQLDVHNLIHMDGRVYDPVIGRFLSADLFVHSSYDTQSFNRYSYVRNNPLSATDPTGYDECSPAASVCGRRPDDYDWNDGLTDQRYRDSMDEHRYYENPGPQDWHIDTSGIMIDLNSFSDEEANKLIGEQQSESRANRNWERSDQLFTSGAINGQGMSLDATDKLIKAHSEVRAMVHGTVTDPEAYIYLSKADQHTIMEFELMQALATNKSISSYKNDFLGSDTFIWEDGLASRNFLLEGHGMVKGGEFNYISVGMMAAHYNHSLAMVPVQSVVWNSWQLIRGKGWHNYGQMWSGSFWGGHGYAYYRENK